MPIEDHLDVLGEGDPLVRALRLQTDTTDLQSLAPHIARLDRLADDSNFLEIPTRLITFSNDRLAPDHEPAIPRQLGPYVLIKLIGFGAFSRVFEGHHVDRPGESVAVKVFEQHRIDSIERIEIERLVLRKLRHPHVVSAVDWGQTESGHTYLVMQLVKGLRIDGYVRHHKLSYPAIARLFETIARALDYCHQCDVIHRDLKPNNILVAEGDFPVVTDFGLAKRISLSDGESLTATGAMIGTLGYLAPEQADSGRREVTRAVDIYGLGATLYCVLTGIPPHNRDNLVQALEELIHQRPIRPSAINPAVPRDLQMVCLKCLEKSPRERYPSMQALAEDLQRFAANRPVLVRAPRWSLRLRRWCFANPVVAGLSLSLGAVVLVGLAATTYLWQAAMQRQREAFQLLNSAHNILQYGDKAADDLLQTSPGVLQYRYERSKNSVGFFDQLLEHYPWDERLYRESATSYFRLAKICCHLGRWEESQSAFQVALQRFRTISQRHPEELAVRFDIFHSLMGLDEVVNKFFEIGAWQDSHFLEGFEIIQELVKRDPVNVSYRDALACAATVLAERLPIDQVDRKLELVGIAWNEALQLKKQFPQPCLLWCHAGGAACEYGEIYLELGDLGKASDWLKIAKEEVQTFLQRPDVQPRELLLWSSYLGLARRLAEAQGDHEAARRYFEECVAHVEKCVRDFPDHHEFVLVLERLQSLKPSEADAKK